MIKILDTTLREGEQSDGVFFSVEEKINIAKKLDELGVDIIETGAPAVSIKVAEAVKKIAALGLKAKTLAHSRPLFPEIDQVIESKVNQIGLFLATSNLHLNNRLHMTKTQAIDISVKGIKYAKKHGLEVRYTPEDATRTDINFLLEICGQAKKVGADRICIADTVGIEQPESYGKLIKTIVEQIKIPIELHCHNDMGLALANTLAGIKNGASYAAVTVNGIGERCGITDLTELIMALKILEKQEVNCKTELLSQLSSYIEKLTGIYMAKNKPIVGANAFSHKGGLHTDAVLKDPHTYEAFDPKLIGRERNILVDRYAGKKALDFKLKEMGINLTDENLIKVLKAVKKSGDNNEKLTDSFLAGIAKKYFLCQN